MGEDSPAMSQGFDLSNCAGSTNTLREFIHESSDSDDEWSCEVCDRCYSTFEEAEACETVCLSQKASEAAAAAAEAEEEANAIQPETDAITLVVLTGLPGLGKSYFLKQLTNLLAEPQHTAFSRRVCVAHKDELAEEFRAANKNRRPKMPNILDLTRQKLQQLDHDVIAPVLVFNMNMNPDWLKALVKMLKEGYTLGQVVVLTPPPEHTFRQLQAAAVVLASDVRTGNEEADVASTLEPHKAWEVIMGDFFGTPGKAVKSVRSLSYKLEDDSVIFREVHYPVPQLSASVVINETAPTERPSEWNTQNLVFPPEADTAAALLTLLQVMDLARLHGLARLVPVNLV